MTNVDKTRGWAAYPMKRARALGVVDYLLAERNRGVLNWKGPYSWADLWILSKSHVEKRHPGRDWQSFGMDYVRETLKQWGVIYKLSGNCGPSVRWAVSDAFDYMVEGGTFTPPDRVKCSECGKWKDANPDR